MTEQVTPLAVAPPITIGELANVPAPGSQLAAQWAQDATARIIHRFANKAALDGWTAALTGTHAVTLDTGVLYRRVTGGWTQVTPWTASAAGVALASAQAIGNRVIAGITVPADAGTRIVSASCLIRVNRFTPSAAHFISIRVGGAVQAQWDFQPETDTSTISGGGYALPRPVSLAVGNIPISPGTAALVETWSVYPANPSGSGWSIDANAVINRLDVTVTPKGY